MKLRNNVLRNSVVLSLLLCALLLGLWSTGNFPPVALANSGGTVTTYTLTGTFNLASGRLIGNYTQSDDQDYGGVTINDSGAQGFDIGYQHDLSASSYAFVR